MELVFWLPWSQKCATGPHLQSTTFLIISLRSNLISYCLRRRLPSDLLLPDFRTRLCMHFPISPVHTTCLTYLILLDVIIPIMFLMWQTKFHTHVFWTGTNKSTSNSIMKETLVFIEANGNEVLNCNIYRETAICRTANWSCRQVLKIS
jgi:hypothetical protein